MGERTGGTAADVIRRSGVTKCLFTLRFREAMGHSVRAEIEQVRLARVLTLLAETDTPLGVVADMCGFGSEVELRQIFRKRVRTSMKEWRALNRPAKGVTKACPCTGTQRAL